MSNTKNGGPLVHLSWWKGKRQEVRLEKEGNKVARHLSGDRCLAIW